MVFAYTNFRDDYPCGGIEDCIDHFASVKAATKCAQNNRNSYGTIVIFDRIEGIEIDWTYKT
jgi:hypothetical protein